MIRLAHGACTHVGQVRRDNEDAFVAIDGLYVVADGMGGHSAGEVASALTVTTIKDAYTAAVSGRDEDTRNGTGSDTTNPGRSVLVRHGLTTPEQVAEAVALANTAVFVEALDDSAKSGMGTTLTALVVTDPERHQVVVANVGDSRTYLWRGGALHQVTKDHSHVQTLVDRGAISKAEARVHYQRNIVLRAIGIEAEVDVDLFPMTVENGDRFILCSDGLVDEADDDEIVNEIRLGADPQELAERLVQLANDNGGRDNVTVIVVDVAVDMTVDGTVGVAVDVAVDMAVPSTTVDVTSGDTAVANVSAPVNRSPGFVTALGVVSLVATVVVGIITAL